MNKISFPRIAFHVFAFLSLIASVISRVVDRNEKGDFILWKSALVPDGVNYFKKTLEYNGLDSPEVQKLQTSIFGKLYDGSYLISKELQETLAARPLYPWLTSILPSWENSFLPLIVPIFAYLASALFIYLFFRSQTNSITASIFVIVFASSFYVKYNLISSAPDGLAFLLLIVGFWFIFSDKKTYWLSGGACLLLSTFSRPTDPIILSALLTLMILNRKTKPAALKYLFIFFIVLIHLIYIQVFYNQLSIGGINTASAEKLPMLDFVLNALMNLPKHIFFEFGFLITNDPVMFFTLIISVFFLVSKPNSELFFVFAAVFLSSFFLGSLNGSLGSGFRYQMPIYALSLLVIARSAKNFRGFSNFPRL